MNRSSDFDPVSDPLANTAICAALVGGKENAEKRNIAARALSIAFLIILICSAFGKSIFHPLRITLRALRVAGGILVLLIGHHIYFMEAIQGCIQRTITVIAMWPSPPMLAGPGIMATEELFSRRGYALSRVSSRCCGESRAKGISVW